VTFSWSARLHLTPGAGGGLASESSRGREIRGRRHGRSPGTERPPRPHGPHGRGVRRAFDRLVGDLQARERLAGGPPNVLMTGPGDPAVRTTGAEDAHGVVIGELRRRDLDRYVALAVANSGALERELRLQERTERELGTLSGVGVWLLLSLLRLLGRSPVRMLVATERDVPVGTTMAILSGPWAYVAAVGVRDDRRHRGIAQGLVRRAEEVGRKARKTWMVLEVDATNEPARRLYAKLGWTAGASVRWWELPAAPPKERTIPTRPATRRDRKVAHAASARRLGFEIPRAYVSPCELACRGIGGSQETVAVGASGAPALVARSWAAQSGEPGFLLPVVCGAPSFAEGAAVLEAGRARLLRRGARGIFVPVVGDDPTLEMLLVRAEGVPKVTSEFWSKPVVPS